VPGNKEQELLRARYGREKLYERRSKITGANYFDMIVKV